MAEPFKLEVRPNLRPYEAVILVHPDATEDDQKALFRKNKTIIKLTAIKSPKLCRSFYRNCR